MIILGECTQVNDNLSYGQWYDSEFFKFKIFKKGTLHIEFKDKFLYEQFNVIACKGKNWLPDSYGHSTTQGKGQPHSKAKVYKDPVNKPSFVDLQPKEEINIDNLLQAVKEIKNKNDVIQLNMLMENAS